MAGYSDTPLDKKLGIKTDSIVCVLNAPLEYEKQVGIFHKNLIPNSDIIQFFTQSVEELDENFKLLKQSMKQTGAIWISWPKKSSGIDTNLNENIIRELGIAIGLVDIKVAAIDNTWSGLKFVIPLQNRK